MDPDADGNDGTDAYARVDVETADGHVATGVASDDRLDVFVDVLGCEPSREPPTSDDRLAARDTVRSLVSETFRTEPTAHRVDALDAAGVPAGPLNDVGDVLAHERTAAPDLAVEVDDPAAGPVTLPGHPIDFPDVDGHVRAPAPAPDEHTADVFGAVADDRTTLDERVEGGAFGGG